jgi:hypothetical protein
MSLKLKFEPASVAPRTHISQAYLCLSRVSHDCDVHVESSRADYLKANNLRMVCHKCGDALAKQRKHTIAPLNKSNYYYIHDPELLKQLNPKRTT